jgi:hypothetical protein
LGIYFLVFEVKANTIKTIPATTQMPETINRTRGRCQNVGGTYD